MSRRSFFTTVGVAVAGASLARCSFATREPVPEPDPPVTNIEKLMAQGMGALRHMQTDVNGLQMHSLVSSDNLSPHAPVVVMVHGSGLSGRYMIRQRNS